MKSHHKTANSDCRIGYMGRAIAQRLLKAGFQLIAYDRHRTKAEGANSIWRHCRGERRGTLLQL